MKFTNIVCIVASAVVLLSVLCACREESDSTQPPIIGNAQVQTVTTTQEDDETQPASEEKETQEVYVVTEDNELEILTIPSEEGKGDKTEKPTDATDSVSETEPETENKQEETRIELPFVPAE